MDFHKQFQDELCWATLVLTVFPKNKTKKTCTLSHQIPVSEGKRSYNTDCDIILAVNKISETVSWSALSKATGSYKNSPNLQFTHGEYHSLKFWDRYISLNTKNFSLVPNKDLVSIWYCKKKNLGQKIYPTTSWSVKINHRMLSGQKWKF